MYEGTVTFLKAVQRSFIPVLFSILVLSSASFAGTFLYAPVTHQITCYNGAGNVIACPRGNPMTQAVNYSSEPLTYTNSETDNDPMFMYGPATRQTYFKALPYTDNENGTVTDSSTGLMLMYVPATHQITCYNKSGNEMTCMPGVATPIIK